MMRDAWYAGYCNLSLDDLWTEREKVFWMSDSFFEIVEGRHADFEVAIECLKILRGEFKSGFFSETRRDDDTLDGTYELFTNAKSKIFFRLYM